MSMVDTHVYVMTCGEFVKVGVSQHPDKRLHEIQKVNPYTVGLYWVSDPMKRLEAVRVEMAAHFAMTSAHERGEWFKASADLAVATVLGASEMDTTGVYLTQNTKAVFRDAVHYQSRLANLRARFEHAVSEREAAA